VAIGGPETLADVVVEGADLAACSAFSVRFQTPAERLVRSGYLGSACVWGRY
jgi:hypothetical protein